MSVEPFGDLRLIDNALEDFFFGHAVCELIAATEFAIYLDGDRDACVL